MSNPSLPQETLDFIVGFLHDEPEALKACCLSSKLWIPRTRKHLFAKIEFRSPKDFELWKKTFPDPSTSPAYHTRTMVVHCHSLVLAAAARAGGLIRTFTRVARLKLTWTSFHDNSNQRVTAADLEKVSLTPFHGFSSTLKALHVVFLFLPYPQIFHLVRSSPLLVHLAFLGVRRPSSEGADFHGPQTAIPLTLPALTGCLELHVSGGMERPIRHLLDLPGGLRFRRLVLSWFEEGDLRWITELVARCTDTLQSLHLSCHPPCVFVLVHRWGRSLSLSAGDSGPTSVDLSKVAKLRYAVFLPQSPAVAWITAALQTITKHRDLRHVLIHAPHRFTLTQSGTDVRWILGREISRQWFDLDRLLVQLSESRSVRLGIVCTPLEMGNQNTRHCIRCLLPETTERGVIHLV